MPQKRNPDALELARGSGARAARRSHDAARDAERTAERLQQGSAGRQARVVRRGRHAAARAARRCAARSRSALQPEENASGAVEHHDGDRSRRLSRGKGATFRDAHGAVGPLIRESEREECELDALPLSSFKAANSLFDDDVLAWLEPARSVARRDVPGGTGPAALSEQLRSAREALRPVTEAARGNELVLRAV